MLDANWPCFFERMWGFPKIRGTIEGVPIVSIVIFWGTTLGPRILGDYYMELTNTM